jgi:hypothetical protein
MLRNSNGLLVRLRPTRGLSRDMSTLHRAASEIISGNLRIYLIFKRLLVERQQAFEQIDRHFSDQVP